MMIFINDCYKEEKIYKEYAINFVQMLSVFSPHIANEMYEILTGQNDLAYRLWPNYDESKLTVAEKEIAVQINGKLKATISISKDEEKDVVIAKGKEALNMLQSTIERLPPRQKPWKRNVRNKLV